MAVELVAAALARPVSSDRPAAAIAEANHRIANNLSLIAGLARIHAADVTRRGMPLSPREVRAILEELGERVQSVAHLHRLLAETLPERIDLVSYLREIAERSVSALASAGSAELSFLGDDRCLAPATKALPLGLIVGELVTNAIKYAHPTGVAGRIAVSCRRVSEQTILVEVEDDGVGFPEDLDPASDHHLGLRIVRSLADQLGGVLEYRSEGIGISCSLAVPIPRVA